MPTAFCKSEEDPEREIVLMTAPKEMGFKDGEILLPVKYAYGEAEGPFIRYLDLRKTCVALKAKIHSQDRAVFLLYEEMNGQQDLCGHLIWHVDDFSGTGTWTGTAMSLTISA